MLLKYKDIITSSGTLNSNYIISEKFLSSQLYKELLNDTKCLDIFEDITINERASFIIHNMKLSKCKLCNSPYIIINQKRHKLCNHKQIYSKRKIYGEKRLDTINEYILNTDFKNKKFSNIEQKNFLSIVLQLKSLKYVFNSNRNLFDYVIWSTINIQPNLLANLNERLYIIQNGLNEIPKCTCCGKKLKFLNKNIGYDKCSCKKLIQSSKINQIKCIFENNKDFIWINEDEFNGLNKSKIEYLHNKCGNISSIWLWNGKLSKCTTLKCEHCNPISNPQFELESFIKSLITTNIKRNFRPENKLEADIFIENKNLLFEFNGTYWHREDKLGKTYHLNKTNYFNNLGYKLIHIWEYDWINPIKQNILKEKIKALLGVDQTKIYARNCIIKEISSKEKNEFLNKHHIQGEDKSKVKLGLFFENELVAVMTFGKPRFNKNYEWELIRYATKSGYHVLGGAGKLLKYFERNFNPKSIITYADRSYSQGNMYKQIGFKFISYSKPNCYLVRGNEVYKHYQFKKHKLQNQLNNHFNNKMPENENITLNGFYKIYDCGNLIFEKIY